VRTRLIIAVVLVLVGLIWIGQGTGAIQGSGFMTDDLRWAGIGFVLFVVGAVIGGLAVIRRPKT
jgi:hypothetical protein